MYIFINQWRLEYMVVIHIRFDSRTVILTVGILIPKILTINLEYTWGFQILVMTDIQCFSQHNSGQILKQLK